MFSPAATGSNKPQLSRLHYQIPPPSHHKLPAGISPHSPKFRAILEKVIEENRPELIPSGRAIQMWIFESVFQFCSPSVNVETRPLLGDFDSLEYLLELIEVSPISDQFTDPVRYKLLNRGLENMAKEGVTTAIRTLLKDHRNRSTQP